MAAFAFAINLLNYHFSGAIVLSPHDRACPSAPGMGPGLPLHPGTS